MKNKFDVKSALSAYWMLLVVPYLSCSVMAAAPPPGQALSDQKILFAIERLLQREDTIVSGLLDVEVTDGIVALSGLQEDLLEKKRAAEIAETVKGVRSVINRITLEPAEQSDADIQTAIVNVLQDDPGTSSFPINIHVSKGLVTLRVLSIPGRRVTWPPS